MKTSLGAKPLIQPAPTWVVCAWNGDKPTGMTAAWGGICCSKPPCLNVSLRAATHTHGLIMERKAFTVNVPSTAQMKEADFFGMASGRDYDKFEKAGLTAVASELVDAPCVAEFPLVAECEVVQVVELGLHTMFVGEIKDIKADESVLRDGHVDLAALSPLIFSPGGRAYHAIGEVAGKAFSEGKPLL